LRAILQVFGRILSQRLDPKFSLSQLDLHPQLAVE
jgi:hypothetical protein